jgi:cytochrome c peroxidase
MLRNVVCFLIMLVVSTSCKKTDDVFFIETPPHFPELPIPTDNPPTLAKIALGKALFFDNRLSLDSTLNCSSCHLPKYAFSDTLAVSKGVHGALGKRNAPSLVNSGFGSLFNKDGGVIKLDIFSMLPIEDELEMHLPIRKLVTRLSTDKALQSQAQVAFNQDLNPYVITRALSSYVRTLISEGGKYDRFLHGEESLSAAEERGRILFFSAETNCSSCHAGALFTNHEFESNGTKDEYKDQGRKLVTGEESDRGKFKIPSLRNVELTAPYMHDGSFNTLESVLDHYSKGGSKHPNKSALIRPLDLSARDKEDIKAFLKTLTDEKLVY